MPQNLNPSPYAISSALNVTANTAVKESSGTLFSVTVLVAGAAGAIYDSATVGGVAAGNKIATIPATVGVYSFNWPCANGIVYEPGASQVVSISFT